jgi:hypothetical protein
MYVVNNEFQKYAIVTYFDILSRHMPDGTEKDLGNLSQNSRALDKALNLRHLGY